MSRGTIFIGFGNGDGVRESSLRNLTSRLPLSLSGVLDGILENSVCCGGIDVMILDFSFVLQASGSGMDGLMWTTLVFCFRLQQPQQQIFE